jgi:fructoselysine-6-P-deglycase FrlB-like protein
MKTLVVHPSDPTTDFLKIIYQDKRFTIANDYGRFALENLIREHDRIIMLGHGSSEGLFKTLGEFCIDKEYSSLFSEKEIICIWCNADSFFQRYILQHKPKRAFYTGMFISEMLEARLMEVLTTEDEIKKSNEDFARIFRTVLDLTRRVSKLEESYFDKTVLREYNGTRFYEYE